MNPRSQPPKGRPGTDHFTFARSPVKPWSAHVAGECYGCMCHWWPHSKPCLSDFTSGEIKCDPAFHAGDYFWRGFLPVYRCNDGRPMGVIVGDGQYDAVENLLYGDRVLIGHGSDRYDTSWVEKQEGAAYQSTLEKRKNSIDVLPLLIHMWNLPELTTWWESSSRDHRVWMTKFQQQKEKGKTLEQRKAEYVALFLQEPEERQRSILQGRSLVEYVQVLFHGKPDNIVNLRLAETRSKNGDH